MIRMAYDYTEGTASEWLGELEGKSNLSWKDVELEMKGHFGSYISMTNVPWELVEIRQKQEESIAALAGRLSILVELAYTDPTRRRDSVVQAQLAEYLMDALENPLIRKDVVSDSPEKMECEFASAWNSEVLLTRLGQLSK